MNVIASAANALEEKKGVAQIKEITNKEKQAIQLRNKYILFPSRSGIMVVDQKAAYERILYDQYIQKLETKDKLTQKVLFPKSVDISKSDLVLLEEMKTEIAHIGIAWEVFGENSILINGLPPELETVDCKELIEQLVEQIKHQAVSLKENKSDKLAQTLAKKAAIGMEKPLEMIEMLSLVEQLFTSSNPNFTPDGKKIVELLYLNDIEQLFQ